MSRLHLFGELDSDVEASIARSVDAADGVDARRLKEDRSSTPFPKGTDLELTLRPSVRFLVCDQELSPIERATKKPRPQGPPRRFTTQQTQVFFR